MGFLNIVRKPNVIDHMSLVGTLAAAILLNPASAPQTKTDAPAAPVSLLRVFKKGEVLKYQVRGLIVQETQRIGMPYMQPSDQEINYDSTLTVQAMKADGFADLIYKRPTMEIVLGETGDRDRQVMKEKTDINLLLTMSPINHVTNSKDLNVKPAVTPARQKPKPALLKASNPFAALANASVGQISIPFVEDLKRVSLFVGTLDTAIDLNPPLPDDDTKVGATWKQTATYQPQAIKGQKDQMQVQRLDWTYVYSGVVDSEGKKVHRITGTLKLDTDVAKMVNAQAGSASRSGLEALPIKMDMKVEFDLDLNTRHTLAARSESKGSWSLKLVGAPETVLEERFTGRTTLRLVK